MARKPAARKHSAANDLGLGALKPPEQPDGLALDQLSAALAGMLRTGDDPYAAPEDAAETEQGADETAESAEDLCEITPRSILEAMLFVGDPQSGSLTSKQVAGLMRGVRPAEIDALVRELNRGYAARNCPYTIVCEGGGYRLALREEFARMRERFYVKARQARLSQAAIEVLAAVAYNAPITADEVSRLRGMPCGHLLLQLVRRQLLRLEQGESRQQKARYYTTERFLQLFDLSSLDDLPRSTDLDEK